MNNQSPIITGTFAVHLADSSTQLVSIRHTSTIHYNPLQSHFCDTRMSRLPSLLLSSLSVCECGSVQRGW